MTWILALGVGSVIFHLKWFLTGLTEKVCFLVSGMGTTSDAQGADWWYLQNIRIPVAWQKDQICWPSFLTKTRQQQTGVKALVQWALWQGIGVPSLQFMFLEPLVCGAFDATQFCQSRHSRIAKTMLVEVVWRVDSTQSHVDGQPASTGLCGCTGCAVLIFGLCQ